MAANLQLEMMRRLQVTNNAERYPIDLQPWGAHASGLVVLPDGTVVVNWYGGTCRGIRPNGDYLGDPQAASRVYLAALAPGAAAFSAPQVLGGDGGVRYMDANLFLDGGVLWGFYVRDGGQNDTVVYRRIDDPQAGHFGPEQPLTGGLLGRIMNPPVRLGENIFAPVSAFDKKTGPWRDAAVVVSSDDGASFWQRARIECSDPLIGLREPCFVVADDTLQMYARVCVHTSFWEKAPPDDPRWAVMRSVSTDGGYTWTVPEPTNIANHNCKVSVIALGDRLIMAYNDSPERYPLRLAESSDGGESFTPLAVVEPGPGEMSYPTLFADPAGGLHISYTWNRREIVYMQYSVRGL